MFSNKVVISDMKYIAKHFSQSECFENKNILITGAAGFLGFYFSQFFSYLINNGVNIKLLILLDNFFLGRPGWMKELVYSNDRIRIVNFDISKGKISSLKNANKMDFIIHMASIASPTFYRKYPIETIDANIWGLRKLLDFYKDYRSDGFLFFSSSEIYGDPDTDFIPTSEDYKGNVSCVGPRACYDESKRFGETLCYEFSRTYNMPITIVRPFNNFGPGMKLDDKRVPADFANSVLNKKDIVLYSDGTPTRTFCYVADAIVGYLKALVYGRFDYFNIGRDKPEISIKTFAQVYKNLAYKMFGYRIRILFKLAKDKNYLVNNPSRRCPDIRKARKLLGFNPQIKIEEGVKRFLEYLTQEKSLK